VPKWSKRSAQRLETCDDDLIVVFDDVVKIYDCTILCGFRNEMDQMRAYTSGRSKLKFPDSKHNNIPSMAVDVVPWPIDWDDLYRFFHLAGIVKGMAYARGVEIIWGGDWKTFKDFPHYQLKGE